MDYASTQALEHLVSAVRDLGGDIILAAFCVGFALFVSAIIRK
jgi:hypothetical protein